MEFTLRAARAALPAPLILLLGCATVGQGSYESMRGDVDRAGIVHPPDERPLTGSVLERDTYVRAVLERNPTTESARQSWRAAVARVRSSGALPDPMVTLEAAPLTIGSSRTSLGYVASVSQEVPWFGKLSLDSSVARAEADAARSDFEAMRREVALTAALLYDRYYVAVRSLEINAEHVALMRQLEAGATAQFESGHASAQDPLQAEAELTHMEHDSVTLASDRDVAVAQMNELLHRDPELPLPPPAKELRVPAQGSDVHEAPRLQQAAIAERPEVKAAQLHARAEEARAERAARESYPDVTVMTSYNSMWDAPEQRWMVGVGLNLPIQLGRRAGAVEEARSARARFESDAAAAKDKARTEVVVALKRLAEAQHVLRLYDERLIPIARMEIDAARAGFITSRNDFVAVVAAEKNLRSVELEYQVALAGLDQRRAELDRALGRIPGLDQAAGAP